MHLRALYLHVRLSPPPPSVLCVMSFANNTTSIAAIYLQDKNKEPRIFLSFEHYIMSD
jgi:hypothetical protein